MWSLLKRLFLGNTKLSEAEIQQADQLDKENLPVHIAIACDGNGRWAKARRMPRTFGHFKGVKRIREIAIAASELGIQELTMWFFSAENWKRDREEVDYLMSLPSEMLKSDLRLLMENNIKARILGNRDKVPAETLSALDKLREETKENSGMIFNFAFNYGGRDDLTVATRKIAQKVKDGDLSIDDIDESVITKHLFTADSIADPDLFIRPGNVQRISNYLLWQFSYTELYFTPVLWPDFTKQDLYDAVADFQSRSRRYGGL